MCMLCIYVAMCVSGMYVYTCMCTLCICVCLSVSLSVNVHVCMCGQVCMRVCATVLLSSYMFCVHAKV